MVAQGQYHTYGIFMKDIFNIGIRVSAFLLVGAGMNV
jgi:hypothetical protein